MSESNMQGGSAAEPGASLDSRLRASLKSRARDLEPCLRFGKRGIPEESVSWLLERFETTDLIKVRFEKSIAPVAEELARELAQSLKAELVQFIGRIAVLYRPQVETPYGQSAESPGGEKKSGVLGKRAAPRRTAGSNRGSPGKKGPAAGNAPAVREVPKK